jgi:hypothetical protein
MKPTQKSIPSLRPICHKRIFSDNTFSSKIFNEDLKNPESKLLPNNFNILSPKYSVKSFLHLNPNFKKNRLKKTPVMATPRIIIKKCDKKETNSGKFTCKTSRNTSRKITDRFNHFIFGFGKLSEKADFEFSFGKSDN